MDADEPISRSINICGQILDVDPRTGRTEVNHAKPFSKRDWNEVAKKPHTLTVVHADSSESVVTVAGATYPELRDDDFMASVSTGGEIKRRLTGWHSFVERLAKKYPDRVMSSRSPPHPQRVIVAVSIPASIASAPPQVRISRE